MTVSATQALAHELQLLVAKATRAQVRLDAAVASLELREDAEHGRGWSRGDLPDPRALGFRSGLGEPCLVPRPKPLLAECVVGGDLCIVDAGDVKQQRDEKPRSVLASHAMP